VQVTRAKAAGALRWLGLVGERTALEGDLVVVSPHIDDAVLSVGAAISHAARNGSRVTVLTVLAGNPESTAPAEEWDRSSGFSTAGEAAAARRVEDANACARLGARPVWLPFCDEQYERGGTDDEIRAAVKGTVGSCLVLLPGFPLEHPDHRWLHGLLQPAFPGEQQGLYAEQPYAARSEGSPGAEWRSLRAGLGDRRRKIAASRAYTSQLEPLERPLRQILRYEVARGGEAVLLP
jgi:LmbE family N-acetylglucosaminyl deacetylase